MGNIGSALSPQGDVKGAGGVPKILAVFRRIGHRQGELTTLLNTWHGRRRGLNARAEAPLRGAAGARDL